MQKDKNTQFYEFQQLDKKLFRIIGLILIILNIVSIVLYASGNYNFVPKVFLTFPFMFLLLLLSIYWFYIESSIDKYGIYVNIRSLPFVIKSKIFLWEDISKIHLIKSEENNTGNSIKTSILKTKISSQFGFNHALTTYTISGYNGIQLFLKNNNSVFIGTTKPDELFKTLLSLEKTEIDFLDF